MGLTSAKYRGCNCLSANGGVRKPLQGQSADVVDGKRRLLVASRGCWWQAGQAEVVESSFEEENNEVSALSHAVWRLSKGFHCSPIGNIVVLPKGFDTEFFAEKPNDRRSSWRRWFALLALICLCC